MPWPMRISRCSAKIRYLVFLGVFQGERRGVIQSEDQGPKGNLDKTLTAMIERRLTQDGHLMVPPSPVVTPALVATTTPATSMRRRTLGWWTLGVSAVVTGVGVGLLAMNGKEAPGSCPQGTKQYQCTWDFPPALYGSFLAVGGAGLVGSVLLLTIPEPARPAIERNK